MHTLHFLKKSLMLGSLNALNIIQFAIKKNQLNIDSQNMNWISSMLLSHQIIHESPPTTVSTWIWWTHYALRIVLNFVQDCWLNPISAAIIQTPMVSIVICYLKKRKIKTKFESYLVSISTKKLKGITHRENLKWETANKPNRYNKST